MPTIEIVSVGATQLNLEQPNFKVAVLEENKLVSHRGIFFDWLIDQKGVIVHLGNPDLKGNQENGFFAGEIIDWEFESDVKETESGTPSRFKFLSAYWAEVILIIEKAISASQKKEAYFLTDIQFEPEKGKKIEIAFAEFIALHNSKGLNWNTLYKLS